MILQLIAADTRVMPQHENLLRLPADTPSISGSSVAMVHAWSSRGVHTSFPILTMTAPRTVVRWGFAFRHRRVPPRVNMIAPSGVVPESVEAGWTESGAGFFTRRHLPKSRLLQARSRLLYTGASPAAVCGFWNTLLKTVQDISVDLAMIRVQAEVGACAMGRPRSGQETLMTVYKIGCPPLDVVGLSSPSVSALSSIVVRSIALLSTTAT